ncbi:FtsB family cell division protein [Candidatus Magnetaquicoccus inordinatus]|uniref:FtsB family cell division protein n=1 Tax=Candidatus Magnetaquicoccus inordinatus TaxID=2496818 RepID=UPI00102CF8CA|nr:septum formation initiator family protein [Candidatus Magnetaquicoccus inordinatus]
MSSSEHTSSFGVFLGLFLLVANVWIQYILWFGDQGLVRWRQTQKQYMLVMEDVKLVEKRIQQIKDEIMMLEKDPMALEEVARRELGMVYPDEIVFIVPKDP